jgi:hypothetical protein
MVENFVGYMGRNPQPGHPGHAGSAQIMKAPRGHPRKLIEPTLGIGEVLEGLGSEQCEDKRSSLVYPFQPDQCLPRQVDDVRFGILCSVFRDRPNLLREI